jgi:heme/copper-type cytochrome/quinol oxidase subunit 3
VLNASLVMLIIDRRLDAHFFQANGGGSAILWQHFFWTFGHPEVYIMALPAFGMISEVIPVFSRKPIFGYEFVAASTVAIAILSFGVWAHHMFAAGLGHRADLAFAIGSMAIAVPTGVKIFNWIATMWGGTIRFTTAMMFATAFLMEFVIGGLSGITFAAAPIDWQVTDTYYLVAHFHYVLFGGTAFAIFAGLYYWFPKMTGRLLDERWGRAHFWLTVVGFNLTFFVQHFLGIMGMPRRVFTYPDLPGWGALNMASTVGAFVMAISVIVLAINLVLSVRGGQLAGDNPWDLSRPGAARADTAGTEGPPPDRSVVAVWAFIVSETAFFVVLILSYVFFNISTTEAAAALDVKTTGAFTVCLLASSVTLHVAERSLARGSARAFRAWMVFTLLLGCVFLAGQANEYAKLLERGILVNSSLFASTFFTLTGFHGLHVTLGLVALGILAGLGFAGGFGSKESRALKAVGLYWHFVDAVWAVVFSIVYVRNVL